MCAGDEDARRSIGWYPLYLDLTTAHRSGTLSGRWLCAMLNNLQYTINLVFRCGDKRATPSCGALFARHRSNDSNAASSHMSSNNTPQHHLPDSQSFPEAHSGQTIQWNSLSPPPETRDHQIDRPLRRHRDRKKLFDCPQQCRSCAN